jgi:hypothetical protein
MKPTQEQVIAWAREAGLHLATDVHWMPVIGLEYLEKAMTLAYEAGRKDENEACAEMCEVKFDFCGDELLVADAIRARREQ